MATVWNVLTALALLVAAGMFVLVIYPFRSLGDDSRKGAGFLLFASTLLVFVGLHFATHP